MIRGIIRDVKRLLRYTGGAKPHLFACIVGHGLTRILSTWFIAVLLGNGIAAIQAGDIPGLWTAVLETIPLLILIMAISSLTSWLNGFTTAKATVNLRESLMKSQLSAPLGDSTDSHSGTKLSFYTNDVPAAMDGLILTLAIPASAAVAGSVGLIYVLSVHWRMAVVALGIGIFTYIYSILFAGVLHRIAAKMQELMAAMEVKLKDILDGIVTIRLYGMRDSMEEEIDKSSRNLCRAGIRWARVSGLLGGMNNATHYLTDSILIFAAGLLFLGGELSLPELIKVSQMAGGIVGVFHVSRILIDVQRSLAGAQRVFGVLDTTQGEESGEVKIPVGKTAVRFESVNFGYSGAQTVIRNAGFTVEKGEAVALIGPSGGGKSTVLRLIQGLYRAQSGSIEIMGVPLEEWDLTALRNITSLVPQEPVLFPGSIAANIAIGDDNTDMARVEKAAKAAGADGFIRDLPGGYETTVAERGDSLSGGQRQRIAIARALYRDSPILLLDEATSAVDTASEAIIHDTLRQLKGEKTILLVTHRASALDLVDRMITIGDFSEGKNKVKLRG